MRDRSTMLFFIFIGAVTASAQTPQREAEPAPPPMVAPRPPLSLDIRVVSSRPGLQTVEGVVRRRVASSAPISVRFELPPGCEVTAGQPSLQLPPEEGPGESVLRVELRCGQSLLTGQLRLVAEINGPNRTTHITHPFRFGSAPAAQAEVRRDGPRVFLGGHDVGPSVALPPPASMDR